MAQKKSDQVRRVGHGSSFGFTPLKKFPSFSETFHSDDPREARKNQMMDEAFESWRRSFQRGSSTEGAVVVINRGSQGGSGISGSQGSQGSQGAMGFQGAGASGILVHVWIAYRTDGIDGTGLQHDPYDGSSQHKFDTLMRGFGPGTFIHIGPGTFLTRGNITGALDLADQWDLRTRWKIHGSGMDSTVLKLVEAAEDDNHYWIIFSDVAVNGFSDDVEVADLTLDCNLAGQPGAVAVGGLSISGNRNKVQRIRIINWGSKANDVNLEPFAFGGGSTTPFYGDIYGFLIDSVFIGRPADAIPLGYAGTYMAFGGGDNQFIWSSTSITRVGSVATVDLGAVTHELNVGKWFRIRNATQSEYNGSFKVSEVTSDTVFKFLVAGSPATPATGTPEVEHPNNLYGRGQGMLRGLTVKNCTLDGEDYPVLGSGPHGLTVGGCEGAIIENNTIRNMFQAFYMDTWRGISIIIKSNIIEDSENGIVFNLGSDLWGFETVLMESNLIELKPLTGATRAAINLGNTRTERPLGFGRVTIRNNIIRFVGGADDVSFSAISAAANSVESLVVTGNLMDLNSPLQIRTFGTVLNVFAQNNRTSDGRIVLAYDWDSQKPWFDPDIEADKINKLSMTRS